MLREIELGHLFKRRLLTAWYWLLALVRGQNHVPLVEDEKQILHDRINRALEAYRGNKELLKSNDGKWCIVTGANSGIGLETAKILALEGLNVIMACRSEKRGEDALKEVERALKSLYLGCLLQQGIIRQERRDDATEKKEDEADLSYLPSSEQIERVAIINSIMDDNSTQMTRDDEEKTLDRCLECLQRNVREKPVFAQRLELLTQQMESIPTALASDLFPKYLQMVQQPNSAGSQSRNICKFEKDALDECMKEGTALTKIECAVRQRKYQLCMRSKHCHTQILSCLEKQKVDTESGDGKAVADGQWPASVFSRCVSQDAFVQMCANNNKIA